MEWTDGDDALLGEIAEAINRVTALIVEAKRSRPAVAEFVVLEITKTAFDLVEGYRRKLEEDDACRHEAQT